MGLKSKDPCLAAAMEDEPIFVLLARDPQAPDLVRKWARDREAAGQAPQVFNGVSNTWEEEPHPEADKIAEARYCAAKMEVWRYEANFKWRENNACGTA